MSGKGKITKQIEGSTLNITHKAFRWFAFNWTLTTSDEMQHEIIWIQLEHFSVINLKKGTELFHVLHIVWSFYKLILWKNKNEKNWVLTSFL